MWIALGIWKVCFHQFDHVQNKLIAEWPCRKMNDITLVDEDRFLTTNLSVSALPHTHLLDNVPDSGGGHNEISS